MKTNKTFEDALNGLNKVQTPLTDNSAEESVSTNHGSFRDDLMMDILKTVLVLPMKNWISRCLNLDFNKIR